MKKTIRFAFLLLLLFAMQACNEEDIDLTVTIQFDTQGGNTIDPITINVLEYDEEFEEPIKEGYKFISWNLDLEGEAFNYDFKDIDGQVITLYAVWEKQLYDLIFLDEDETILHQESIQYGEFLEDIYLEVPTKLGYTFNGWDIDLPNKMPEYDVTAKATYIINRYRISFETNGADLIEGFDKDYNETFTVDEPTREGHAFLGWFSDHDFETPFAEFVMPAHDVTLYAKWERQPYNLMFMDEDETILHQTSILYDEFLEDSYLEAPTKLGYTFNGWDIDLPNKMPGHDVTAKATYIINRYRINFETNGANPIEGFEKEYNETFTVSEPSFEGYVFIGWFLDEDFETSFSDFVMPAQDITLYAKWDVITYDINYVLDGGTNGSNPDSYTVESNTIILEDPVKEGYAFDGWLEGSDIAQGSIGNKTFTAIWLAIEYDVNYYVYEEYNPINSILLFPNESIINISLGYNTTAILTSQSRVFTWGSNSSGQLGDGTTTDRHIPLEITHQFNLASDEIVIQISLGAHHSAALTSEGRLFTWGYNWDGSLGIGTTTGNDPHPNPIDISSNFHLNLDETIIQVSLGFFHSSALTSEGRVFIWGRDDFGQIGDGMTAGIGDTNPFPTDITSQFSLALDETIIQLSLGSFFSSALSSKGRVFTWGSNLEGTLGIGTNEGSIHSSPIDITSSFMLDSNEKITMLSLGWWHVLGLSSEHRVFAWGSNVDGQLGDGTIVTKTVPTEITSQFDLVANDEIIQVSTGFSHSAALSAQGRLFVWGWNWEGQLGNGTSDMDQHSIPLESTNQFGLKPGEIITMVIFGGYHCSSLTSENRLFTWGSNTYGELGNGDSMVANPTPTLVDIYMPTLLNHEIFDFNTGMTEYYPTLEGYTFSGWYIDATMETPFVFTELSDKVFDLYGYWVAND